ncbi:hypothetical protein Tco_1145668 [Tanacetum coccineum]
MGCMVRRLEAIKRAPFLVAIDVGASSLNLRIMNKEFVKLDKFDGCNYTRWADKMKFLLIVLKIFYVLDPLLAHITVNPISAEGEEVNQNEVLNLKKQRMIRKEDETLCCGHIMNSLSDILYDVYAPITDPQKLWSALEFKYKQQEEVGAIISKLPHSWNDISKKLINKKDDYSLDDLLKHLRIEE